MPPSRLGGFTLRPDQRATTARVLAALRAEGGALLADPPGTGKTVIALAVARALAATDPRGTAPASVVAPAALRAQWQRAADRAGTPIRFTSLESLGRATTLPRAPLVIVDEAHHVRSPATRRYARLAEGCIGARVLLLTATPVVNRPADRDALLALFLGARAAALEAERIARIVIRRRDAGAVRPAIRRLPPLAGAADLPGLGEAIRTLPPPLPAADGTAARALVRLSLAMAWRSGVAALDAVLRRRILRGTALREALAGGRWPDRRDLRRWAVGDDALQLAFPAIAASPLTGDAEAARRTLEAHLDAVAALRRLVTPARDADTAARAEAIRALRDAHPARRVVVLAAHADTIHALWSILRHDAGTVAVTGTRVRAAAGRWSRTEVLAGLGPRAGPLRTGDPRAIRLLLATDLLAEGVELQGAGILVHADRAWTPARHEQREGRLARVGASVHEVLVARFRAPRGGRALVRLGLRLARKAAARRAAILEADALTAVRRTLERWGSAPDVSGPRIAAVRPAGGTSSPGRVAFLALVRDGDGLALVAGRRDGARWRVTRAPRGLLAVVRRLDSAMRTGEVDAPASLASEVRRVLATDLRRREARRLLGDPDGPAALRRRATAHADAGLARAAPAERLARATDAEAFLAQVRATPGIGAERRLARTLRAGALPDVAARGAVPGASTAERGAAGRPAALHPRPEAPEGDPPRPRLAALLILRG